MDRPVRRPRLINRRQQGDLGEASAIEWLTSRGATVFIPVGHSPDVDLVAEADGRLMRIQVKTSTQSAVTPDGHKRCVVKLTTSGGNQSWNGVTKRLDSSRVDHLFVLAGDGRRWFIPTPTLEAQTAISLGGSKYSEFEIEPGRSIHALVYGADPALESQFRSGEYPSGQRTAAVNRQAMPSQVRILPPPSDTRLDGRRFPGRVQRTRISANHQVTIPSGPFRAAGFAVGDRLYVEAIGAGEVRIRRIDPSPQLARPPDEIRKDLD